jgi:hypothetical protein
LLCKDYAKIASHRHAHCKGSQLQFGNFLLAVDEVDHHCLDVLLKLTTTEAIDDVHQVRAETRRKLIGDSG